ATATTIAGETIPAGTPIAVDVCFQPQRRGRVSDSISVVLRTAGVLDTIHVRVTGNAVGPQLEPNPFAINFARTNPGFTSNVAVTLRNIGERPYTFDATSILVPPPFALATAGPIVIPAGGAISIDLAFVPTANGVFSESALLTSGCASQLQIGLNGATDFIGTGAVMQTSKLLFNAVNKEEAPCHVSRCTPVTISNAGNARLIVDSIYWALPTNDYTITNPSTFPFIIQPNDQHTLQVCLDGSGARTYIDTLIISSNSRASIAFGLLMDLSGSMDAVFTCGSDRVRRIVPAIQQAQRFISNTLLHLPAVGVQDHLAIIRYSDPELISSLFHLQPIDDASRAVAQRSLNGLLPDGKTHTGLAMMRMMDTLMKSPLDKRVIILLSDGAATDPVEYPPSIVAARAVSLGIKLYTIGIGVGADLAAQLYLQNLAELAGGVYYDGDDCTTLQAAFESITESVSRGQLAREPFEIRVTEPALVSSGDLNFDSTYYLSTTCKAMTLTNVGEGEAVVDSIQLRDAIGATSGEFFFPSSVVFPLRVPESGQLTVDMCFRPTGLRLRGGTSQFAYNSCAPHILGARVSGTGWATAALRIDDERIGLPGTIATMPVHLDSSLVTFEVGTVSFSIRWNKTMLDLQTLRPLAAAGTGSVSLVGPVRYEERDAVVDVIATGDFQAGAGALAEFDFLVLRGDTLVSDIALTSLLFEDNNPKALMKNAGMIAFDSTCFRSTKAIRANSSLAKLVQVDATPNPARRDAPVTLTLRADGATSARVTVHNALGDVVIASNEYAVTSTTQQISLDANNLPVGAYFVIVEDGAGITHVRHVVVAE
ncbi:MAG: choice-of-anchor D domain-containing protein, partial [bacterium]|nr:choice-of-anchor D domain-containing protein [Candidatus Kapabacteria bacterium]